jgi:NAD-dependent SIR2 family protein deacetylase
MLRAVAGAVRAAGSVVAPTGAGIFAESGVPTSGGAEGLRRSCRPGDLATLPASARAMEAVQAGVVLPALEAAA